MIKINLSGHDYGLWHVLPHWEKRNKQTYWQCECTACGQLKLIEATNLKTGKAAQCKACVPKPNTAKKHGMSRSVEYRTYQAARTRCTNSKQKHWKYWGGRGVEFRFTSFEQWFALLGPRPSCIHSVDRIDTNGHYEPGNVRWVTLDVQSKNKRPRQRLFT